MKQPSLFDAPGPDAPRPDAPPDQAARDFAVDPAHHVVLEASAGTGKTRVLVDRYVRLLSLGVDPRHILAVTFTRKAAAEMRERVLAELRRQAEARALSAERWRELQSRVPDIQISTIDAFCFGLLREFPLEAGVDPGFEIADETEMARFADEGLDLTFRAIRGVLQDDETVRLLLARIKQPVLREVLAALVDRRHVALPAVAGFVARHRGAASAAGAASSFVARLRARFDASPARATFLADGPASAPEFRWLMDDLTNLAGLEQAEPGRVQQLRRRLERYFLTQDGKPRQRLAQAFGAGAFASPDARRRHQSAVQELAPGVLEELERLDSDVNGLLARGLLRVLVVSNGFYERLLADHSLMDFAGMLHASVALLERQEEFARSRLKLQARYHHVLVDEFQDTSRPQWRLVELLVDAWGEGLGAADAPTSIFIVGDRKQSIYRFRHADVRLLDEAARKIGALRPGRPARQAISHSFRAVPELLAFVNALAREMVTGSDLDERFRYDESDHFSVAGMADGARRDGEPVLGLVAEPTLEACATAVAGEIARLLESAVVRDRSGARPARPDDFAILFRARAGHQYFEEALERFGIRTYVYKGLGFFDAPEVQDLQALLRFLARPDSSLRAGELLRSRLVRLSDTGLVAVAPDLSRALCDPAADPTSFGLTEPDLSLLAEARASVARWLALAARLPPSELVDVVLRDTAYPFEMRGRRLDQARENVKKVRLLVRRVESRGYATLERLASYFDTLRAGEESNAIVGAADCVNLMTIHAAKGLEFPVVFVVNMHMSGRNRPSVSVIDRGVDGEPEVAFQTTDGTKLEERREQEELRRLLYVAVTRARDRLYLAAELDANGAKLKRGARSLASLLPGSLAETFAAAAAGGDIVSWQSAGQRFDFLAVRDAAAPPSAAAAGPAGPAIPADVQPLAQPGRRVAAVTDLLPPPAPGPRSKRAKSPGAPERLVGTLVHRLMQKRLAANLAPAAIRAMLPGLVTDVDLVDLPDPGATISAAADAYVRLRRNPQLKRLLASGEAFYEVPFSWAPEGADGLLVRGSVDCLIRGGDGVLTILEFKTGEPRPEHEAQVRVYADALGAVLGGEIGVEILYA